MIIMMDSKLDTLITLLEEKKYTNTAKKLVHNAPIENQIETNTGVFNSITKNTACQWHNIENLVKNVLCDKTVIFSMK